MGGKFNRREFIQLALAGAGSSLIIPITSQAKRLKPPVPIPKRELTSEDWKSLKQTAREVYARNRVEIDGLVFHMPSYKQYRYLFGWDSGWHAIALTRFEPELAKKEVLALCAMSCEDGRIPHQIGFKQATSSANPITAIGDQMIKNMFDENFRSWLIDPPSYMVSAEKIYNLTQDKAFVRQALPALEKCGEYLTTTRDLFGDGLPCIIHPWESGTDNTPCYDQALKLNFKTPLGALKRMNLYPHLLDRWAKLGWDIKKIAEQNVFVFEDLTVISITIRGIVSLARLNQALGRSEKTRYWQKKAEKMIETLFKIHWDEKAGIFFSRYDLKEPKLAKRKTLASLLPAFTGLVPEKIARRMIEEHLFNPEEFWDTYIISFNSRDELAREKIYFEDLLLWRGHCIWCNFNWMMCETLLEYGYSEPARELTRRFALMILAEGFREFYDYRNGEGKGARNFTWPALVLDMIAQTHPEIIS